MPRIKLIYVGDGQWIEPTAKITDCEHPPDVLRFDSRFAVPSYKYCTACGQAWIPPFHGRTEAEIAEFRRRGAELADARVSRICSEIQERCRKSTFRRLPGKPEITYAEWFSVDAV